MSWFTGLVGRSLSRDVVLAPRQQQVLDQWRAAPRANMAETHAATRYVVVDVETSGLDMKNDRLISIGAVALVDERMDFADAFQVVVRQDRVSTRENILIHGIGGCAQSEGMNPAEALLLFLTYIGKSPLVAYHAFFDQTMIDKALGEYLGVKLDQPWIDLAWVLPDFFPLRVDGRVALDDWLQAFDIENIMRHNAVSDAYATAKLMQMAMSAGNKKGAKSPASFQQIEKARRWMYESR